MEVIFPTWAVSLIVAFVAILGAYAVQRFIARRAACSAFRSAVLAQLSDIYPAQVSRPKDINVFLNERLATLQTAIENFRPFVHKWRHNLFDSDWHAYREFCRTIDNLACNAATMYPDQNTPHPMQVFKSHVDKLLSYAKET